MERAQVVIAGAGPVGKVLALELARHGVSSTMIDPGSGVTPGARARLTNARTMEHLRRLGLADRVRELAPLPRDYPVRSVYLTAITGYLLAEFRGAYASEPDPRYSEPSQYIPQDRMELALLEGVMSEPSIRLLLAERVNDFHERDSCVVVELDGGDEIEAHYLIGCDGAHSTVRDRLGIGLVGQSGIMHSLSAELRSVGLRQIIDDSGIGRATQHWIVNPLAPVLLSTVDGQARWTLLYMHTGGTLVAAEPIRLFQLAVGAEVDCEVLEITPWSGHRLLATSYGDGRVMIAGDAAHLHPPTGGYGMNTGIGDAVNLAWKIAAIEAGWGSPHLLDTYELERRPVHARVISEAVETGSVLPEHLVGDERLTRDTPEGAELRTALGKTILEVKARQHRATGVILGDRYDGSPLSIPDGTPSEPPQTTDFKPSGRPGARLPHVWLADGSSLFDRLGLWYTLLDLDPSSSVERSLPDGLPVDHVSVESDELRELVGTRFALVRPDQHVAWRGDELPDPGWFGHVLSGRAGGRTLSGAPVVAR